MLIFRLLNFKTVFNCTSTILLWQVDSDATNTVARFEECYNSIPCILLNMTKRDRVKVASLYVCIYTHTLRQHNYNGLDYLPQRNLAHTRNIVSFTLLIKYTLDLSHLIVLIKLPHQLKSCNNVIIIVQWNITSCSQEEEIDFLSSLFLSLSVAFHDVQATQWQHSSASHTVCSAYAVCPSTAWQNVKYKFDYWTDKLY